MASENSLQAQSISHARSSRDLVRGDRRSVQARYNFSVDKNDLNENIDDSIKNFDSFSQFCAQYAQQDDAVALRNDSAFDLHKIYEIGTSYSFFRCFD